MCTPLCSSVPPALHGQGQWVLWPPHATQHRCVFAPLWAAVTAQWLRDSTLASWSFSRASEGASRAGGGKVELRDGHSGCQEGTRGGCASLGSAPRRLGAATECLGRGAYVGALHSPRHLAQQGLSLVAGLVQADGGHSWRWQCVSPDWGAERGAEHQGEGQQLLRVQWLSGVLLSHHFQSPGDWHSGTFPSPGAAPGWHTHHTPAQDTLHFSKGGHKGVPALIVEVPATPKAACPWCICLHGVSQLWDTPLGGCRKGHWENARLWQGSLWHCQWGYTRAMQGG